MLDDNKVDLVIALPGGKGTADMIERAKKANIEVRETKRAKKKAEKGSSDRQSYQLFV